MKVEKTYRELLEFSAKVQTINNAPYGKSEDDIKARVLLLRASKKFLKPLEEYEETLETLRIKHCLKDKDSNKILKNEKGEYEFDSEGSLAIIKEVKELQKTVVEAHYDTQLPYSDLLVTLPDQAQPFWQWEDVQDTLSPVYTND